jgi:hypothetical protein
MLVAPLKMAIPEQLSADSIYMRVFSRFCMYWRLATAAALLLETYFEPGAAPKGVTLGSGR